VAKGIHYFSDGKKFRGAIHKMADGTLHTGARHTASSKRVFDFKDLSASAKRKARSVPKRKA